MSTQKIFKVIGIMSGTSMDGLDFSLVETDGKKYISIICEKSYIYSNNYKYKLKKIIKSYNLNKKINKLKDQKLVTEKFIQLIILSIFILSISK